MSASIDPLDPAPLSAFPYSEEIATRWSDNDAYGHVNNAAYYLFFDSAVNRYLIQKGVLDIAKSPVIGLVVETRCRYFMPLEYPDPVTVGVRAERVGTSSITYGLGIFKASGDCAARGLFTHVYVDRDSRRPTKLPDALRAAAEGLIP